jgi:hypothetical protein
MQILPLCRQGSLLLIESVQYSVKIFCHGNGRKNYPGPRICDVLHRPLCEDSDKIPKGRTSTYILSVKFSPVSLFFFRRFIFLLSGSALL